MTPRFFNVLLLVALAALSSGPALRGDEKPKIPLDILVAEKGKPPNATVEVREITPRGIGYRMGMVKGDVIVGVNGYKVISTDRLGELLKTSAATVIWKGADGKYYKNTVSILQKPLPGAPPSYLFSELEDGKTFQDVEKKPLQEGVPKKNEPDIPFNERGRHQ